MSRSAEARRRRAGLALAAPALAAIGGFFALPVLGALALSFTDFDIYALADLDALRAIGLQNYTRLLSTPRFWVALGNTLYFVAVGGPLSVIVSLGAALLLDRRLPRLRGVLRTVFFLPVVTTLVAVAVVWRFLYHPHHGLLNWALGAFGIGTIDWLGDPRFAMPAIILLAVWKNFGFNMVIFLAGLQAVPERLHEAARIDGAGDWSRFRHVTLPVLAPTFLFVTLVTMIGHFQLFAEPYVMTQGGPADATLSLVLLMYEEGFRFWNLGFASAVAFVLFALLVAGTLLQLALARQDVGAPRLGSPAPSRGLGRREVGR